MSGHSHGDKALPVKDLFHLSVDPRCLGSASHTAAKGVLDKQGYAVLVQDTRGRFSSSGEFVPVQHASCFKRPRSPAHLKMCQILQLTQLPHTHLVILVDMAMSSQQNKLGSRHRDKLHRTVQAADFQMCTLTVTQPMIFSPKKTKAAQISWTTGTYKV